MPETVLWDWNVHAYDIDGKLEAAAAGSFDVLTVPYRVYAPWLSGGGSAERLLERASDAGVRLDFLDGMSSWCSVPYPPGNEFLRQALDFSVDDALRLCDQLALKRIVAIAGFDIDDPLPIDQLVDEFGRFCERADQAGLSVDFEFMGMLGIRQLELAWQIVREAGQSNAAIMFDTWHFARGDNEIDALRKLPRGAIRDLQLVDGGREPVGESLWDDTTRRGFPGEGELPITELTRLLLAEQDIETIGPEAIPQNLENILPRQLGIRAAEATARVLEAVTPK